MNQPYEETFSIDQMSPKPVFSYSDATFTINVIVRPTTTRPSEQTISKVVSLGVVENEPIEDAHNDMDMLAQQIFED